MKEQPVTDVLLRQFLLGRVDDEERQRIESLFITDPRSRGKVLAAEQDLIEDYLEDSLTKADRESFLLQYAETSTQQRKIRIARSIKEYSVAQAKVTETDASTNSKWGLWLAQLRLKPILLVPIAAILMIAVVVAAVWLNNRREERNAQHLAIERELADLNAPSSLGEPPSQMLSFALSPVSLRSAGPQAEFTSRADIRLVELRLLWIQKVRYATYRALLRRVGSAEQFTIKDLRPEDDSGKAIRLRLPARLLTRGLYQISLSGIAADGAVDLAEEYSFTVGG
jgi:hypothetical protein